MKRKVSWQCVNCHSALNMQIGNLVCVKCGAEYKHENGYIDFLRLNPEQKGHHTDGLRDFFKRWPKVYYFLVFAFGPVVFSGIGPKKFLKRFHTSGLKVNLGSGPRQLEKEMINLDIFPFIGVDVVADIEELPFEDNSVERIVCDNVLEHVKHPTQVIDEMRRVLTPGGLCYIAVPFLYPFHHSPSDYTRWTEEGLRTLCGDFEIVRVGTRSGIFSTLTVYLCYLVASLLSFGSNTVYAALVNISIFIFWPIKLLDLIFFWLPTSNHMAAILYIIIKKKV